MRPPTVASAAGHTAWPGARCVARAVALAATLLAGLTGQAEAQAVGACRFDRSSLQFEGTAATQAACLLRRVSRWGVVDSAPATLPPALTERVGQPTGVNKAALRQHLVSLGWQESSIGGSLDDGLSRGAAGAPTAAPARYFVIHDTSAPWLGNAVAFPPDSSAALNKLAGYGGPDAVAHVFVNRLGATLVGHPLSVPWRATKLETQAIGLGAKGVFLHVELLQPRRRDPAGGPKNDALAPEPGFTGAQYASLALLYVAASVRRGDWLIPAFHACIDQGLSDAHDDPQHFNLDQFGAALSGLLQQLQ